MGWFSGLISHFGSYVPWTTKNYIEGPSTSDTENSTLNGLNASDASLNAFPGQPTTYEALMEMFKNKAGSLRDFLVRTKDLAGLEEARTTGQNTDKAMLLVDAFTSFWSAGEHLSTHPWYGVADILEPPLKYDEDSCDNMLELALMTFNRQTRYMEDRRVYRPLDCCVENDYLEPFPAHDKALAFHYLRILSRSFNTLDITSYEILTPEDVDRLVTCGFVELADVDFPLGAAMLGVGAYRRVSRATGDWGVNAPKDSILVGGGDIKSCGWWTVRNGDKAPTTEEIREYIHDQEDKRFIADADGRRIGYFLDLKDRGDMHLGWLEELHERHGRFHLKEWAKVDDVEALKIINTTDTYFVWPDHYMRKDANIDPAFYSLKNMGRFTTLGRWKMARDNFILEQRINEGLKKLVSVKRSPSKVLPAKMKFSSISSGPSPTHRKGILHRKRSGSPNIHPSCTRADCFDRASTPGPACVPAEKKSDILNPACYRDVPPSWYGVMLQERDSSTKSRFAKGVEGASALGKRKRDEEDSDEEVSGSDTSEGSGSQHPDDGYDSPPSQQKKTRLDLESEAGFEGPSSDVPNSPPSTSFPRSQQQSRGAGRKNTQSRRSPTRNVDSPRTRV